MAVAEGADAIGIILYPASPRFSERRAAIEIARVAGPFLSILGLFVDAEVSEIREMAQLLHLSTVQLQGSESPEIVERLKPLRVIKAIRPNEAELNKWRAARTENLIGVLLETPNTGVPGGSGVANDWDGIERLKSAGAFDGLPPIIFAGGLNPENVGQIVRRFEPYAMDVSSGVESAKREKSPEKIAAFIKAVHKADHDIAHARKEALARKEAEAKKHA